MKTFSYRPQPVRRTYIEKEGSDKLRPLGIPAYEDRLVQGVIAEILEIIYEPKFYDFSYGFREGRDCHQAIKHLDGKLMGKTSWVVDADIKGFFDNVDHDWMMKFLEHEISDKNFLRYIKRFLKAGIMEAGAYAETDSGVPQGGLCSPIMANVYLHYVIDMWFDKKVTKESRGDCSMVRYADDAVFCFQYKEDADNFYKALKERLAKFGLEISEEKSKIIKFGRFAGKDAGKFDFLGFTFMCGTSRNGKFMVKCRTSEKKLKIKRVKVNKWMKENMHTPINVLIYKLNLKLRGHYNYYGLSHNIAQLRGFYRHVTYRLFKTFVIIFEILIICYLIQYTSLCAGIIFVILLILYYCLTIYMFAFENVDSLNNKKLNSFLKLIGPIVPDFLLASKLKTLIKSKKLHSDEERDYLALFIRYSNKINFYLSIVICIAYLGFTNVGSVDRVEGIDYRVFDIVFEYYGNPFLVIFTYLIAFRLLSRSIEIIVAFYKDIIDKSKTTSLDSHDRFALAVVSFIEMIIIYTLGYKLFGNYCQATTSIKINYLSAPYKDAFIAFLHSFGVMTFRTVDFTSNTIINIITVLQVVTGMVLVVFSIAKYIGGLTEEKDDDKKMKETQICEDKISTPINMKARPQSCPFAKTNLVSFLGGGILVAGALFVALKKILRK